MLVSNMLQWDEQSGEQLIRGENRGTAAKEGQGEEWG